MQESLTSIRPLHFLRRGSGDEDFFIGWMLKSEQTTLIYGKSHYLTDNRIFTITRRNSTVSQQPVWLVQISPLSKTVCDLPTIIRIEESGIDGATFEKRSQAVCALEALMQALG